MGSKDIVPAAVVGVPVRGCFPATSLNEGNGVLDGHALDEGQVTEGHERRPVDARRAVDICPVALSQKLAEPPNGVGKPSSLVVRIEVPDRNVVEQKAPTRGVLLDDLRVDAQGSATVVGLN